VNPYEELGIAKDADAATVKRAYRKAAKRAHPDRGGDAQAMTRVNVAYDILSDPARRERYDLGGEDIPATPPLELRARMQLGMAFQHALQNPARVNIPKAAKVFLTDQQRAGKAQIAEMKQLQERFKARLSDVIFAGKPGEQNVFLDQANAALGDLQRRIEATGETVEAIAVAIELLAAYSSTVPDRQPGGFTYGSPFADILRYHQT
jgi:curved DNA-binding protein CbpA